MILFWAGFVCGAVFLAGAALVLAGWTIWSARGC